MLKKSSVVVNPNLLVGIEIKKARLNPIAEVREPSKFSYKKPVKKEDNEDIFGFIVNNSGPSTEMTSAESTLKKRKTTQMLPGKANYDETEQELLVNKAIAISV